MLSCSGRKISENILFQLDELIAFRFQVNNDVSFISPYFIADLNEEGGFAGALPTNNNIGLAA